MRKHGLVYRNTALSVATHGMLVLGLVFLLQRSVHPRVLTTQPGIKDASLISLTYNPGSSPSQAEHRSRNPKPHHRSKPDPGKTAAPVPAESSSTSTAAASSQASSLGDGDIQIALLENYPTPSPNLSTLAPGTKGDVVLDVVIDKGGKITSVTLVRGMNSAVDDSVIATVRQWTFSPAVKEGTPIASTQQLLFHYERT